MYGLRWYQLRKIHVVAVLCSLLAAGGVFALFNRFGVVPKDDKPQRLLVASVDLRIGSPGLATQRGEAQAQRDLAAGLLQLQTFGLADPPSPADAAKARRLKQRYGVTWVNKADEATPLNLAWVEGYNRAMQAEIERRQGKDVLDRLLRDSGLARQDDRKELP